MPTALETLKANENVLSPDVRERWTLEQLATIITTVAQGATLAEFAMFTELAQSLDLNPLAKEIWFTKSKSGKVMIMVGRDGLLKCARRDPTYQSLDYDVHREKDTFRVIRREDGTRTVYHEYEGSAEARGRIVGAWAMIRRKDGNWTNYTYCPWDEYAPKSTDAYSPWGKQESAMMAKCAQSLALRIGCGITGVVGEDEVVGSSDTQSLTAGEGSGEAPGIDLPPEVEAVIARAADLGHAGYSNRAAAEVALGGRSAEVVAGWVSTALRALDALEAARASERDDPAEAEVVPEESEAEVSSSSSVDVEALRRRLSGLYDFRAEAEGQDGSDDRLAELDAEIDQVEEQLRRVTEEIEGQAVLDV